MSQSLESARPPSGFTLRTLGELALLAAPATGAPVVVKVPGKTLALLAFLAGSPSRTASRSRLVELLWASAEPDASLHSLRQARFALRRAAGEELVDVGGELVTLSWRVRVDRDDFKRLLLAGARVEAAALYGGSFCEGFAAPGADEFERWADVERATLRSQCVEALAALGTEALARACASSALAMSRRLAEVDEDGELRWRLELEAVLLQHDGFGARQAAGACREWLSDGAREPSRTLRLLLGRATTPDAHPAAASTPGIHPDLVGRDAQFAAIVAAWKQASENAGRTVLVVGAAGYGKTRLLRDVEERLLATRARIATVRALPADTNIRFALAARLAAALAVLRGAAALSERSAAVLTGLNPALSSYFRTSGGMSPLAEPLVAYIEALDELIGAVTEEAPVAVLVDDLHWSDLESARVLASLGERQARRRLLLVLAMRDRRVGALPVPDTASVVRVGPLSSVETECLLGSIATLPERGAHDWIERLTGASRGNPLLILETLRLALGSGALTRTDGHWRVRNAPALLAVCSLESVLADRLAQLTAPARALALVLAVAGRPLRGDAVHAAESGGTQSDADLLHDLEVRDVARHDVDGWTVAHDAVAETLLAGASAEQFTLARLRAARAMHLMGEPASVRGALHLFAALQRWDDCVAASASIARIAASSGTSPRGLVTDAIAELPDTVRAEVRRRLPWALRVPARGGVVAAIAIVMAVVMTMAFVGRPHDTRSDATTLLAIGTTGGGELEMHALQLREKGWSASEPLDAGEARRIDGWPTDVGAGTPSPAGGAVAFERLFADSGQLDVALWFPDGHIERLTSSRGDDIPGGWAPDGRTVLVETSRWGRFGHRAIAAVDVLTRSARRISTGGTELSGDAQPSWSPDGSRIAFVRRYYDRRPSQVCTVDVDGVGERCRNLTGGLVPLGFGGWIDAGRLLVWTQSGAIIRSVEFKTSSDSVHALPLPDGRCTISPDGRWFLCDGSVSTVVAIAPTSAPQMLRSMRLPPTLRTGSFVWGASTSRMMIDGLTIRAPTSELPVGVGTMLVAEPLDDTRQRVYGAEIRWSLTDPRAGTISSRGVIVPARAGEIRVRASVGGWRSAEAVMRASAEPPPVLLREGWTADYLTRWRPYGTPRPQVGFTAGRATFRPGGDDLHFSGAYLTRHLDARPGLWVETELSTPLTATQWQVATIGLLPAGDRRKLAAWDHVTGYAPMGSYATCGFTYPQGEGEAALQRISPGGDMTARLGYPTRRLGDGRWYRVLVQLLPDGRCGLAIDGRPIYLSEQASRSTDSTLLMLQGASFGTRILMGPLTVGRGVRADIPWHRLERNEAVPR